MKLPAFLQAASALAITACLLSAGCAKQPATSETPETPAAETADGDRVLIDVTMTQGTNMSAALSPDGETLAIALQGVIWTLPASGGKATAITPPVMDSHEPAWSPDGTTLTFYAFAENAFSIWTAKADGSDLTEIETGEADARYPSFSPDGESILFSTDQKGGYQVWSLDLASGEAKQLTVADETGYETPVAPYFRGAGNAVYPTLSPDGTTMAFVIDGEMDTLVTSKLDGASEFNFLHTAATLGAPAWSGDSQTLYVAGLLDDAGLLTAVPVDGSEPTKLVEGGDIFPFRPSLMSDDTILYTADGDIKTVSTSGEAGATIPFEATVRLDRTPYERRTYDLASTDPQEALGIIDPVLSPDGSKAAFAALGDLWIADLTAPGEAPVNVTEDAFIDLSPSWSPDGETIAFSTDRGGVTNVWLYTVETGEMSQLTDNPKPANSPIWSPDGTRIAYLADALTTVFLGSTVNAVDVETGEDIQLSEPIFGPSAPGWSPDGSVVTVVSRHPVTSRFREGYNALFLMPSDGEGEPSWATPVGDETSLGRRQWSRPAWSSAGDMVYRLDGALYLAPMDADGTFGASEKIAEAGENPSWSADGSKLIYIDGADILSYDKASGEIATLDIKPTWSADMPDSLYTIRAGYLFDGDSDTYQEGIDIVVEDGLIREIRPAGDSEPEGELIDASDAYVLPGLIESHTHQSISQGWDLGETWFANGITTVRETGDDPYHAVERREAAAAGVRPAPRVFTAGPLNEGARISYGVSETVGTVERAKDSMRLSDELKLDFYKSYVRQDYSVQKAVIEMAHESGIPVTTHELYPSVANGLDQMEHFGATSRRGYSLKISALGYSYQDVVSLISESGLVVTPTLALMTRYGAQQTGPMGATLKAIMDNDGKIVAGTDSPFIPYGESLHKELEIYQGAGVATPDVLKTATSAAADAIGVGDQLGRVKPGYLADILILSEDPLKGMSALESVETVLKNGEVVYEAGDSED
ncbi:amidohydrolase family protein [Henriciella aquimarina]|uniref:amidohydrolase family protein n=1 Tax=Henriciella aquimarina TaxID=545261 RepID=UPI000A02EF6C|nr:amidohydrolase family protein [Henriciella aquimarina]